MADEEKKATDGAGRMVIVVLEMSSMETVKTAQGFQLLNCDDHLSLHKKLKKDPADSRPDITHQELLALLDSPLNKAGLLKVFIRTTKNVLIEVNPKIRIPRTFKRFAGLMVQLLHKLKIRSSSNTETLLKVVKNPVSIHLPAGARKIGLSVTGNLVHPGEYVASLPQNEPIVLVFGAMAHGHLTVAEYPYIEEMISVSAYPLSGAQAISRLLGAFENQWGVL